MSRKPPPPRRRVRPLADLVSDLVDPIMARKAGMTSGLVVAWPEIAGPRLATGCRPEKLVWPPRRHEDDPFEPATLVVACEGASAMRLQHQVGELVSRTNAFFGFHAVARIKIVQRALSTGEASRRPVLRSLEISELGEIEKTTAGIEDPRLRAALDAYGRSLRARRPPPRKTQE